jgi:hypothetical protein
MKRATKMAVAAGAITTGIVAVGAGSVSAGCGMTLEMHNRGDSSVTVDFDDSKVQVIDFAIKPWKRFDSGNRTVAAGDTASESFVTDLGCSLTRNWRIEVNEGSDSWFVHAGTGPGDTTLHVHVEP